MRAPMETTREEAAPTFPTWRKRLEETPVAKLPEEVDRFLQVLKAVGSPMIDGSSVSFVYYDPNARRVLLTGEFNQWSPRGIALTPLRDTGLFYHTMQVLGPARVEYKFIVDGEWMTDPLCPNTVDNGIGEQNSSFVVGDFQEPPELEWLSTIPHGRVEEFTFESTLLNNRRRVYVYLPPDYEADLTRSFPTLYVHDGGEYLSRAKLPTILDNLTHSQEIPPLMAVMVDPVDRMREYWANEDYGRFMERELLPYIESHYRALAQREARGVMGASLGGLISTYLALSRPQLFSKVGGQSSALFLLDGGRGSGLAADLQARFAMLQRQGRGTKPLSVLVEELQEPVAFYFDVGKYEPQFIPAHHRLVPRLEAKGCPCFFQELTGGHNWTSWRAHLKDLLTFLWRDNATVVSDIQVLRDKKVQQPPREPVSSPWEFDSLFKRFLGQWDSLFPGWLRPSGWDASVDLTLKEDRLHFTVTLPGFTPQDVEVLVVGNQIVIKGKRTVTQEQGPQFPFMNSSRFERTLRLPEGVSTDEVTACYHDGVLDISLPAPQGMKTRRIPIEVR
jgi:enterochelin esterase family protein